jgi:hypothetical protein
VELLKLTTLTIFLFLSLLISSLLLSYAIFVQKPSQGEIPDVFVGVDVAYADLPTIKNLIDEISCYTNTFVIGSTGITNNITKLDEVCQYLYDKGMYFIIYWEMPPETDFESYKRRWGDRFLGFYAHDEIGGRQLDLDEWFVQEASNYTDAANQFVNKVNALLNDHYVDIRNFTLFSSDYALYWFDYKAGYDVIFAEFGWNYSRQLNVALNRGAATAQNKDWGVMITWTYNNPPYLESGSELYQDMVLAYNNGAKYILVFDTNKNYTQGILKEDHLDALKQFWDYAKDNPRTTEALSERVAYVLPTDYAYGFRGPYDKIWGLWEAENDSRSFEISVNLGNLLKQYETRLDIIYDDELELNDLFGYSKIVFWNGTVYNP